jgi:hypothetical protein
MKTIPLPFLKPNEISGEYQFCPVCFAGWLAIAAGAIIVTLILMDHSASDSSNPFSFFKSAGGADDPA